MRKYLVVSAYMLALESASPVPENEKMASIAADSIEQQDAEELECMVCLQAHENGADLFICPGSGANPHALHMECLQKSELRKDRKKVCPGCTQNWETQLIEFSRKALEYSLLNSTEYTKATQSMEKTSKRTLNMEELKEVLLQMIDNFGELLESHEKFQNTCDRFLHNCPSLSKIYGSTPNDYSILRNQLSEIDKAFGEVEEDKSRRTSLNDFCQFLVNAPKCVYTNNVGFFISAPIFFAQLDPQQRIDFWVHLLTLAKEGDRLKDNLSCLEGGYIFCNLGILDRDVLGRMLSPIEGASKLWKMRFSLLVELREFYVDLSPECRERLAKIAIVLLTDSCISILETISIFQELGFFTEFTKEMRERLIGCLLKNGIGEGDEKALEILYLKDSAVKREGFSENEILELLKKLIEIRQAERGSKESGELKMVQLDFYYHMVSYTPTGSNSDGAFLRRIHKLLKPMRTDSVFFEILPFLPAGTFKERVEIVLGDPKEFRGVCLRMSEIVYLYSGVEFDTAAYSLFSFIAEAENSNAGDLECLIMKFGIFFRKDLESHDNAMIFYEELKEAKQYAVMLFFRQHFTGIPECQSHIADKMDEIIKVVPYIKILVFSLEILYALYDSRNRKVKRALYKHFPEYVHEVLDVYPHHHLFSSLVLHEIFGREDFSDCIEPEQIRKMIIGFADSSTIEFLFEK